MIQDIKHIAAIDPGRASLWADKLEKQLQTELETFLNNNTMIKLQVIGNLGKDCVVNNVNGKNVINFTVAHTEKYKDAQGNNQEKTTWVDCAYWTDRTAIAPYLTKGQSVFIEGTPEVRTFAKNDGSQGASLSVRVREVQLLGGRNNQQAEPATSNSAAGDNDGLPF